MVVPYRVIQEGAGSQSLDTGDFMQVFAASPSGWLSYGNTKFRCSIGKGGTKPAQEKREGDGASPLGVWPIRRILWREDRGPKPQSGFEAIPIQLQDGWCDASNDPYYNQPITHPYPASAEHLWREDGLYNVIVVLGHNDDPVVPAMGSAIFMHCAAEDYRPTEGCVALAEEDLRALLKLAKPGDAVAFIA
jgi:L,D-peptidoglycan transpeptidase YkuD (ErfK/YbiS/YcfS/YnhG family)